jgi:hypothetical protein
MTDEADRFHAVPPNVDPETGVPLAPSNTQTWTSVFADEMLAVGNDRHDVVATTAAMLIPVGLHRLPRRTLTASSTSASPSSTQRPVQQGWPLAGCTRLWRCTRRS